MLWKVDQPDLIIFLGESIIRNLHIQYQNSNSTAAAAEFWILLSIITYLLPTFKYLNSAAAAADFLIFECC